VSPKDRRSFSESEGKCEWGQQEAELTCVADEERAKGTELVVHNAIFEQNANHKKCLVRSQKDQKGEESGVRVQLRLAVIILDMVCGVGEGRVVHDLRRKDISGRKHEVPLVLLWCTLPRTDCVTL
jgi:hypothetical protein